MKELDTIFDRVLTVKLANPDKDQEFRASMIAQPGVRDVLNQKNLIDRLFAVLYGLRDAAFAVAVVQAIGAILLIANMVQVSAFTRRTEIGIMRLVGASRWYTQLPFLLEDPGAHPLSVGPGTRLRNSLPESQRRLPLKVKEPARRAQPESMPSTAG